MGDKSFKMSDELRKALKLAYQEARVNKDTHIRVEHLILGILTSENKINLVVRNKLGDDKLDGLIQDLQDINKMISVNDEPTFGDKYSLDMEQNLDKLIKDSKAACKNILDVDLVFINALTNDSKLKSLFYDYNLTIGNINNELNKLDPMDMYGNDDYDFSTSKSNGGSEKKNEKPKTPMLDNFGKDLTKLAIDGKLDPVIGRDEEVERVAQILTRRKKNNPILIGEPGVGKSSIVECLAIKIANNDCPRTLREKRVIVLDLTSMVAGTKYRGQFEERIKALLDEVRDNKEIILFIDEIHTIVGAGNTSGSLDAANILKPALARGEIQCIGATTLDEYREHIESDGALERRFQKIMVNAPSTNETIDILNNIKSKYEDYHNVLYSDDVINEIVRLADRYITNREFPDKAIDILDEAGSRSQMSIKAPESIKLLEDKLNDIKEKKIQLVKSQNFEEAATIREEEKKTLTQLDKETKKWENNVVTNKVVITEDHIAEVVSMMTDIPVSKVSQNEIKKLLQIDKELAGTVIGQETAIAKVVSSIKRNRTGVKNKNKPIGSFLFIGASGVGKCVCGETTIKVRNKITNEIKIININEIDGLM